MLWVAIERMSVQIIQFSIGIILARYLMPDAFGLIGMLSFFITLAQVLVDSGMERGQIFHLH